MSRLTDKREKPLITGNEETIEYRLVRSYDRCINKLGKLEDLEEIFPFSIEKMQEMEGIYVSDGDRLKKYKIIGFNFKEKQIYFWMDFCPMYLSFDEYKKMFWLKEDKSE